MSPTRFAIKMLSLLSSVRDRKYPSNLEPPSLPIMESSSTSLAHSSPPPPTRPCRQNILCQYPAEIRNAIYEEVFRFEGTVKRKRFILDFTFPKGEPGPAGPSILHINRQIRGECLSLFFPATTKIWIGLRPHNLPLLQQWFEDLKRNGMPKTGGIRIAMHPFNWNELEYAFDLARFIRDHGDDIQKFVTTNTGEAIKDAVLGLMQIGRQAKKEGRDDAWVKREAEYLVSWATCYKRRR